MGAFVCCGVTVERNLEEHHQAIQPIKLCECGDIYPICDYHRLKILGYCVVYDIHLPSVEVVYDGLRYGLKLDDRGFAHHYVLTSAGNLYWYSVGWETVYE